MRRLLPLLAAVALVSCATTAPEPIIRTVTVDRPVPVTCVPANATIDPAFRVTQADVRAAPNTAERLRLLAVGFLEREGFIGEVVPVLKGCR